MKLNNPVIAVQHLHGKSHTFKTNPELEAQSKAQKRKRDTADTAGVNVEVPSIIKNKKQKQNQNTATENKKNSETVQSSELRCEICETVSLSYLEAIKHFKGKKHAAKLESVYNQKKKEDEKEKHAAEFKCEDCDKVFFNATSTIQHFQSKKHATKMEKKYKSELKCETCSITFPSAKAALTHFQGKKHAAKVDTQNKEKEPENNDSGTKETESASPLSKNQKKKQKEEKEQAGRAIIKCDDCNIEFTAHAQAISHFKGKRHASKVASKELAARGRGQGQWNDGFGRRFGSTDGGSSGLQGMSLAPTQACNYGSDYSNSNNWDQVLNRRPVSNYMRDTSQVH